MGYAHALTQETASTRNGCRAKNNAANNEPNLDLISLSAKKYKAIAVVI